MENIGKYKRTTGRSVVLLYFKKEKWKSLSPGPWTIYSPWSSPGQNTGVGSLCLLQGIFPIQGSNPGLPHCRWIFYQLSHQGSPRILEWVAYPFSSGSSWPGVSCIAGGLLTYWAIREALYILKMHINFRYSGFWSTVSSCYLRTSWASAQGALQGLLACLSWVETAAIPGVIFAH